MATKVGAFKKDGTVQCVKLVEEAPTSLVSSFGGTISGGGIDLDNGYRLQFKSGSSWDTAVNKTTFPNNFVGLNIWIENNQFSTYGIWFSREGKTNRCTATFNESSYEDRAPIIWEDTKPIKMYFNQLTIEEEASGGYDRSYFASTYLAMYNRNKELIFYYTFTGYDMDSVYGEYVTPGTVPYSDRWKTATVRMCENGTLKCAKLIEETGKLNTSRCNLVKYSDHLGSDANSLKIYFENSGHQTIQNAEISVIVLGDNDSNAQIMYNISSSTGIVSFNPAWSSSEETKSINRITVTGNSVSLIAYVRIVKAGKTVTYNYQSAISSSQKVYTSTDSITFYYNERFDTPTIRVGKDGTIKCAKVQEAIITKKSILNGSTSGTDLLFTSGFKISCYYNNSSITVPSVLSSITLTYDRGGILGAGTLCRTDRNASSGNLIQASIADGTDYSENINIKIMQIQFTYSETTGYPVSYIILEDPRGDTTKFDLNSNVSNTRASFFTVGSNSNNVNIFYIDRNTFTWN